MRLSRRQIFTLVIFFLLLLSLPLVVYLARQQQILRKRAAVLPPNIIVDTQNVLGFLPRFWQGLAQGGEEKEPNLNDLKDELRALEPAYIRLDHIFDFYDVVYRKRDQTLGFNWRTLDQRIQDILNTGAAPFLSLSYMPAVLSSGTEVDLPYDWQEWQSLVQETIEHVSGKEGLNLKDVYYEVWNEPDLFGRFTIEGKKDYRDLYYWSVIGAKKAENVNEFKIGGPAVSHLHPSFLPAFLDYVSANGLRLDFVSWHVYSFNEARIAEEAQILSGWLNHYPSFLGVEKIVSEWGIESAKSFRHGQNVSAAHTIAAIIRMAGTVDLALAFEIKDGPHDFGTGWGIFTHETAGKTPKPRYFALWLAKFLKTSRLSLLGEGTYVKAIAAKDADETVSLLVSNYSPFYFPSDAAVPITFNRLYNGIYKLSTWILKKEDKIETPDPKTFTVTNGVLRDSIFMPENTVALLELRRVAPALVYTPQGKFGYSGDHAASVVYDSDLIAYPLNNQVTAASGTVEMWVKPNWSGTERGERIFFEISPVEDASFLAKKNQIGFSSQLEFGFFEGTASAKTVSANIGDWQTNEWCHLAFVWDNTQEKNSFLKIFVDGVLEDTNFGSWKTPIGTTFYLGSRSDGTQKLEGAVDELRISNLPLYRSNFTSPLFPLTADENTVVLQHFDGLGNP